MTHELSAQATAQIVSIIDDVDDMTIATIREDGFPQATTVSYVNEKTTIYFGCDANSQKAKNIARNGKVSITINRPYATWNEIEGVSMGAIAEIVSDPREIETIGARMFAKFPQIQELIAAGTELEGASAFVRVTPVVISLLDYKQGFGHTELFQLG